MNLASKPTSIRRIVILLSIGVLLATGIYFAPSFFSKEKEKTSPPRLKMAGTSNLFIIMENGWRIAYRKKNGIDVDYDSTGSTNGVKQMIGKKCALAFTHAPLSEAQKRQAEVKGGPIVHIPVVLCAVVPAYNVKELQGTPPLKFTGAVLADIFLGKIDTWNHPALKELNPDAPLPATKIVVVHREDSSGTTFIFADYLYGVSPAWQKEMGKPRNELKWQVGVGKARNSGVAWHVQDTDGAIGYVDLLHVIDGKLAYGAVANTAQPPAFIRASAESMTAAAGDVAAHVADDLTFSLTNRPGKDAYPICGAIWAVCFQKQPAAQHKQVTDFLRWVLQDGQSLASNLSYAPLPKDLAQRAEQRLNAIKSE